MNTNNEYRTEWILRAILSVLFLLFFAVIANNQVTKDERSASQPDMIEIFESGANAIQTNPIFLPEFDKEWIISDNSVINCNEKFHQSLALSNAYYGIAFRFCSNSFLDIKPDIFLCPVSHMYYSSEYKNVPALS